MYEIVNVQYTGTYNNGGNSIPAVLGEFRASSASALPAQNVDCHIICGCDGLDIATGDRYIWNGTAWVLQPSTNAWQNVYTKAEIDSMTTEIYGVIAYYHTVIVSDTGEITFYSLGENVGTWAIYGNGQQNGTPTPDNPVMPEFCGVRTGNLLYLYKSGYSISQNGEEAANAVAMICKAVAASGTYYTINFSGLSSGDTVRIHAYDGGTWIRQIAVTYNFQMPLTFITPENTDNIRVSIRNSAQNLMLNLGSTALPYEPYGYKIPITCGGQTNNIYLSAPLRKAIDGSDAVDTIDSTGTLTRNVDENGDALATPTTETIEVPAIPTVQGENTLTVDTALKPSKIEISGER